MIQISKLRCEDHVMKRIFDSVWILSESQNKKKILSESSLAFLATAFLFLVFINLTNWSGLLFCLKAET